MKIVKLLVPLFALLCAIWFALTGWIFIFYALYISYPFALVAMLLYLIGRAHYPESKLNKAVLWVLLVGLASSIIGQLVLYSFG
jgi:hypothetical protein